MKFPLTLDGPTRTCGELLLDRLRALFSAIHRRDKMRPERFERAFERERKQSVHTATHPPRTGETRSMADRFRNHADAYFRSITTPGVDPTTGERTAARLQGQSAKTPDGWDDALLLFER